VEVVAGPKSNEEADVKRSRKWRVLVCLALLGVLGVGGYLILREREPEYGGKSVSYWFKKYYRASEQSDEKKAMKAFRKMGTSALPYLVKEALSTSKDTALRTNIYALLEKLPDSWHLPSFVSRDDIRDKAVAAITVIDPPADFILLFVKDALNSENSLRHRQAVRILSIVNTNAASLAPYFAKALHVECPDEELDSRWEALEALIRLGADASPALPDLIWMLSNTAVTNRLYTEVAVSLGKIGTNAVAALPALYSAFETETNWWKRATLATVVCQIGTGQTKPLEFLIAGLHEPYERRSGLSVGDELSLYLFANEGSRLNNRARFAAERLGMIGPDAHSVIPALVEAFNGTNMGVWQTAAIALHRFGAPGELFMPKLKERMKSNDADIQMYVAGVILKIDPSDNRAQSVLATLMTNGSKATVVDTAMFLLCLNAWPVTGEAKAILKEALKSGDAPGRERIAAALEWIENKK
jgi:hypothetical protein